MNDLLPIALAYAPWQARPALTALWALDAALGRIVATTTELMIGQMRLTWWHDRLIALDAGEVPAEPTIAALAAVARATDVTGARLAQLVTGWEALLEPMPLTERDLQDFAVARGDGLFALSAALIGRPVSAGQGAGWALIDFARHCSDPVSAQRAWEMAQRYLGSGRFTGPRMLKILARAARATAARPFERIAEPVSGWHLLRALLS